MEDIQRWQTKFEACQYSDKLIDKLILLNKTTKNPVDIQEIKKAIYYSRKYHGSQVRKSGEPYYSHPLEVAYMLSDYLLKTDVIVASILHDTVEDTEVTIDMLEEIFGRRVAEMVDRLTRDRPDGSKLSVKEILINAYDKQDKEVLLIKTIDRWHNMKTLGYMSQEKQHEIALETARNLLFFCQDENLERKLNILSAEIISPEDINYLNRLYSKKFSLDNYRLPSLIDKKY
jgi:(p)ppGpp synthase/HD superfamily hydrolase